MPQPTSCFLSTDQLVITGGRPLQGTVRIGGAKNSVLKLMAAALLTQETVTLTNVPTISDVTTMANVISHLGVTVTQDGDELTINANKITRNEAPNELVTKMRASFNVLAPLLARCGETRVSLPGGCSIGKRGVDLHIKGLEALGAEIDIEHGMVVAKAQQLVGADIVFDLPSVGATENVMVAAVLANGMTRIANAAQEPEIMDLADFLNAMGADITGAGTSEITIHGVPQSALHGVRYAVMPDRIEAATYLIAGAATRGTVTVEGVRPAHLQAVLAKLTEAGCDITMPTPTALTISAPLRLEAQNITTLPYPGIPTDLQAPLMTLLATAEGSSVIKETIYENRFNHVGQLRRMAANIEQDGNTAIVTGVERLSGASVKATDLRAGAAMVIAGLMADGYTTIENLHHLDRGYEGLIGKIRQLGGTIERRMGGVDTSLAHSE
ncbi:MAG: UDP-N-acetylglucosamine 1-carboxyvinyltransferase [Vampirovibrionales bacterium]|nr:UDP-N-acetylglucosamine 1-carboxyvinyltransferase [Vampirovibrionales bacterium]